MLTRLVSGEHRPTHLSTAAFWSTNAPIRLYRRLVSLCLGLFTLAAVAAAPVTSPSVALFYGPDAPLDELKAFDIVVVEADNGIDPKKYRHPYSTLYAYVGVGEAQPSRPWFKDIPAQAKFAQNADWGSAVIDLSHPVWADFVAERIIAPLWAAGYRGFFLDTLDSYRLAKKFDEAAQQKGLIAVIDKLHQRFPGIRLILNRGFDIVPAVRDKIVMVAAESLFQGWDAGKQQYVEVPAADREWLLGQLNKVRDESRLPVLAIDYVAPGDRPLARATAERIKALGIIPWVSDGALQSLGVGAVEVVPRKVTIIYDSQEAAALNYTNAHRYGEMPLNHLGYVADYRDIRQPLPSAPQAGRSAGIVVWLTSPPPRGKVLTDWLLRQIGQGVRVAFIGQFGLPLDQHSARIFGVSIPAISSGKFEIVSQAPMFAFEAPLQVEQRNLNLLRLNGPGTPLLELASGDKRYAAAAITPWGGFVLDPFLLREIPGTEQSRWLVDPFAFLSQALALPPLPLPDVTTENGRRLLTAHIDGDGFPSRGEFPGSPLAGRVLLDEIFKRYRIPHAMSVIEGEIAPHGLYPKDAAEMENIARQMFALPHVEAASHTFSHPFRWDNNVKHGKFSKSAADEVYHLALPGYKLDLRREIGGSIDYIRQRLAPRDKPVQLLLWSGDTAPSEEALRLADEAGLLNLNGGDTHIHRGSPSLGTVSALGIAKGGRLQVYTPTANENIYTNLWTGPFYGFRRAIETFEMTETPRRLKPVGIYYHSYSATKRASLDALHEVYGWAAKQPLHPIFASEYVRKVRDFMHATLARDGTGWIFRGDGELRTLRAPAALGTPDPARSSGLAGFRAGREGNYLHLSGGEARLRFAGQASAAPYLVESNARLQNWRAGEDGLNFTLKGYQPIIFTLANVRACKVSADGRPLAPRESREGATFTLEHAAATIRVSCPRR